MNLTNKNLHQAKRLLRDVAGLLDENHIPYHLEGGTLLGIVRDGQLLPWDTDVDISIPSEFVNEFVKLRFQLLKLSYRLSVRKSLFDHDSIKKGEFSIFKIKPLAAYYLNWLPFKSFRKFVVLDVFVKYSNETHTFWQAKGKVMRVDKKFYSDHDTIDFDGYTYKIPTDHKEYLTLKYGDWSVPVKEWNCGVDEHTIVNKINNR